MSTFVVNHKRAVVVMLVLLAAMLIPQRGTAHIVQEIPWHPVPAAYMRGIFFANLGPNINWEGISAEFQTPIAEEGYMGNSPLDLLANAGIDTDAIEAALVDEARQAFYAAGTVAISQYTRYYLTEAQSKLDSPGTALDDVQKAQNMFRAFEEHFISHVDPTAARELGLAWLDMLNSVGHAGVSGIGSMPANPERFAAAQAVVETYLVENYEVDTFTQRRTLAALPENSPSADLDQPLKIWLPPGSNINDQDPLPLLALNFEERGIEESDIPLIAYGDMLFDSPAIFGDPGKSLNISCSTCHNRSDINNSFFIPGVSHQPGAADVDGAFFNPNFNDIRSDSLDIPTLRGIRFTGPYGRDGRFASLREFTRNVIVSEFGGEEPTPFMLDALVAYQLEFDWQPNSQLNPDGTLNNNASNAALRGEVLFNTPYEGMGNRACSTCHIPSANFIDRLPHDIGTGTRSSEFARDSFFDTPSLINVAQTAPYMHDGSLATLADVVEWFDSEHSLGLAIDEKADLTAYLEAVGAADNPWEIFDEENTIFALAWAELSTFLSTLDTLIEQEDTYHALLLLDTVTPDLRTDVSGATDFSIIPQVLEIADKLDEIYAAIEADDWVQAAELNAEYKTLADAYGDGFK